MSGFELPAGLVDDDYDEVALTRRLEEEMARLLTGISLQSLDGVGQSTMVFDQDDKPLANVQALSLNITVDGFNSLVLTYPGDRQRVVEGVRLLRGPEIKMDFDFSTLDIAPGANVSA